ncbi:MAG TPA: PEP-CTERM-box response regulator transcription factor [Saccharospirillum sp.]|nr:PEP-CTERM-box response regulator transcription factor [Saccharospirillum sp.]
MSDEERIILIVEDDEGLQSQLKWHFDDFETTIVTVGNREAALAAVRQYEPDVVIQDLGLPPDPDGVTEGMRCLSDILLLSSQTKVIVLTGKSERQHALRAIELGAFDFYTKPIDTQVLDHVVARAVHVASLEKENRKVMMASPGLDNVIGQHANMVEISRLIRKIAPSNVSCALIGESGTGKEVLANALHRHSDRADGPFVAVNCAAIPENLMESEFFGYEKGAFTGADKTRPGKIESADGGTLMLDEIGDMPLTLQSKLLRFLQERSVERVGGRKPIPVDVRVICATNKDIDAMVADGSFREDLYYRLAEMVINIPPLRERDGDKAMLARHFLSKYAIDRFSHITGFSDEAIAAIEAYGWPGNVREMENKIKKAIVLAETKTILASDLSLAINDAPQDYLNLREVRQEAERKAIIRALSITDNNVSAAAKQLGITRPTLYDLLKKHTIQLDSPS